MADNDSLRARYKSWRKKLVAHSPFVKRSRHNRALAQAQAHARAEIERERREKGELGYLFVQRPPLASAARSELRQPLAGTVTDELCLFVTHAAGPSLKPHVVEHIDALLAAGISVVLIVNSDVASAALQVPAALLERTRGCLVRENVGYDFGGWAHAYSLLDATCIRQRLYLINDSIIGPLDPAAYGVMLDRIRRSPADVVGLTSNPDPRDHLQSYYLVFNARVLRSGVFDDFMRHVVNMSRKEHVIDSYEVGLTPYLRQAGFVCTPLFANLAKPAPFRDDTLWHWQELIALGFPFVKGSVLRGERAAEARLALPAKLRESLAIANTPPPLT